jgi:transposase
MKSSEQTSGDVVIHHCFFRLADFSKSISVSAGTVGQAYWKRMFAERAGSEEEEERQGKGDVNRSVRGIGDEALWLATPVGGTLYVRNGDNMLRLAVGGKGSDAERLAKATNLARRALSRMTK